jgi:hypothetical protein
VVRRLSRDVQPAVDVAHFEHLIAQNHPRPGRHSHFSVRLALDNDRGLIAGRELLDYVETTHVNRVAPMSADVCFPNL